MRAFLTYSKTATTSPAFPKKGLASHAGRLDVIARMLRAALWWDGIRRDTNFIVTLGGPPNAPLTLWFKGKELDVSLRTEKEAAEAIRSCMKGELKGCKATKHTFEEVLKSIGMPVYFLTEGGEDISKVKIELPAAFVLGPQHDLELPAWLEAKGISIGPKSYLASHCISFIHFWLDYNLQIGSHG